MRLTKKQKIVLWAISIGGIIIWIAGLPTWFDMVDRVMK